MIDNVKCLGHSTIKIIDNNVIYIDPYKIDNNYKDADIIFITHSHYDHFSIEDINKIIKDDTIFIVTEDIYDELINIGIISSNIISVKPNNKYNINNIDFETIPSYNIDKKFHPKDNNWVGYIISVNNIKYYVAGDTDITMENRKVKCDVAFLPVGGTYTMNYKEASKLANIIKPKIVIPIHYGIVVGSKEDAIMFKELIDNDIICEIMY